MFTAMSGPREVAPSAGMGRTPDKTEQCEEPENVSLVSHLSGRLRVCTVRIVSTPAGLYHLIVHKLNLADVAVLEGEFSL